MNIGRPDKHQRSGLKFLIFTIHQMFNFAADNQEKLGKFMRMQSCGVTDQRMITQIGTGIQTDRLMPGIPGQAMKRNVCTRRQ